MNIVAKNHEEMLVKNFIVKSKRSRLLNFITSKKNRSKFTEMIHHFGYLDSRYIILVENREHSAEVIQKKLTSMGAPDECYLISTTDLLDAKVLKLAEALDKVLYGNRGYPYPSFISCIPGKLAYYEGEESVNESSYILFRDDGFK
tara:strand:+ start:10769 stop:11206 length:438 start_codon:yes stop_codon:yes gene_type:complete